MNYEQLIQTVSSIVEDERIQKIGLTLTYQLHELEHNGISESIYNKLNPFSVDFTPSDEFEVMLGGVLVKFKKKL